MIILLVWNCQTEEVAIITLTEEGRKQKPKRFCCYIVPSLDALSLPPSPLRNFRIKKHLLAVCVFHYLSVCLVVLFCLDLFSFVSYAQSFSSSLQMTSLSCHTYIFNITVYISHTHTYSFTHTHRRPHACTYTRYTFGKRLERKSKFEIREAPNTMKR